MKKLLLLALTVGAAVSLTACGKTVNKLDMGVASASLLSTDGDDLDAVATIDENGTSILFEALSTTETQAASYHSNLVTSYGDPIVNLYNTAGTTDVQPSFTFEYNGAYPLYSEGEEKEFVQLMSTYSSTDESTIVTNINGEKFGLIPGDMADELSVSFVSYTVTQTKVGVTTTESKFIGEPIKNGQSSYYSVEGIDIEYIAGQFVFTITNENLQSNISNDTETVIDILGVDIIVKYLDNFNTDLIKDTNIIGISSEASATPRGGVSLYRNEHGYLDFMSLITIDETIDNAYFAQQFYDSITVENDGTNTYVSSSYNFGDYRALGTYDSVKSDLGLSLDTQAIEGKLTINEDKEGILISESGLSVEADGDAIVFEDGRVGFKDYTANKYGVIFTGTFIIQVSDYSINFDANMGVPNIEICYFNGVLAPIDSGYGQMHLMLGIMEGIYSDRYVGDFEVIFIAYDSYGYFVDKDGMYTGYDNHSTIYNYSPTGQELLKLKYNTLYTYTIPTAA